MPGKSRFKTLYHCHFADSAAVQPRGRATNGASVPRCGRLREADVSSHVGLGACEISHW